MTSRPLRSGSIKSSSTASTRRPLSSSIPRAALAAEAADALGSATEANPDHGELWFHYTNLLFKAGRRDEAIAARTHCQSIRPASEYVASCRFLPE